MKLKRQYVLEQFSTVTYMYDYGTTQCQLGVRGNVLQQMRSQPSLGLLIELSWCCCNTMTGVPCFDFLHGCALVVIVVDVYHYSEELGVIKGSGTDERTGGRVLGVGALPPLLMFIAAASC